MASPKTLELMREREILRFRAAPTIVSSGTGESRAGYRKRIKELARKHGIPFKRAKEQAPKFV